MKTASIRSLATVMGLLVLYPVLFVLSWIFIVAVVAVPCVGVLYLFDGRPLLGTLILIISVSYFVWEDRP